MNDEYLPEYPSWSSADSLQSPTTRLAKSRRRFLGRQLPTPSPLTDFESVWGKTGSFDHANVELISDWLQRWEFPASAVGTTRSSRSVFVGATSSDEMPWVDGVQPGPPFVTITDTFVKVCSRLLDGYSLFAIAAPETRSIDRLSSLRTSLVESWSDPSEGEFANLISTARNKIFNLRTTQAAVRWAIAHEMAHAVVSAGDRLHAYARIEELNLDADGEADWWGHIDPTSLQHSLTSYRDEIACDLLAIDFVADSPFGVDDVFTQASGSLVSVAALIWYGWSLDSSKYSATHPSPSLRFQLAWEYWLSKLTDVSFWDARSAPGPFAIRDFATWIAYEQWVVGAYREGRRGNTWNTDMDDIEALLLAAIPRLAADDAYVMQDGRVLGRARPPS